MPPFEFDNILFRQGDHKLMEEVCDVNSIAEAVVVWGILDDFDDFDVSVDEYYHSETLDELYVIITTVVNFSNVFEFEFEQVFSNNCSENMSEEQFIDFVSTRCNLLGTINGYFGYILPCAFVREVMFRFKNHFKCSHFRTLAQKCLAKFLEEKFKEFKRNRSWNEFLTYCKDINNECLEKNHCKAISSNESLNGDLCMEHLRAIEKADAVSKSTEEIDVNEFFKSCAASNDTICKLVASDVYKTDSTATSVRTDSGNYSIDKLSDDTCVSSTQSDAILDLSKAISEIRFGDENEQCETEVNDNINSVCSSDTSFGSTLTNEDDALDVMYNILMPDGEIAAEVFRLIEDCSDFFDNEGTGAKVDESYGRKSDNIDGYFENKLESCFLPNENGNVEMQEYKDFLDNGNSFTSKPYERKCCNRCNINVHNSQILSL